MALMDNNDRHEKFYRGPEEHNVSVEQATDGDITSEMTIEAFLSDIEKRAYHMAAFATGNHADALDLLQDSMIKLVSHYAHLPSKQWKPLFYKILQNRIRDYHRHQKVKNLLFFWKSSHADETEEQWPPTVADNGSDDAPESTLGRQRQQAAAIEHLKQLSDKQRQCFLLRSWEGMSTADTAAAMGCSEGSVKTHYSRAVTKLRSLMEAQHDITF